MFSKNLLKKTHLTALDPKVLPCDVLAYASVRTLGSALHLGLFEQVLRGFFGSGFEGGIWNGSRKLLRAFFSVLLVLFSGLSVSCSMWHEDPPPAASVDAKMGGDAKCLSQALPILVEFVNGNGQPAAVSATWDCFSDAIALFEKSVRGRKYEDRFTSRELASFFEAYFLADNTKVSDTLLSEIFKLKQLFLGGSDKDLTRAEMFLLIDFAQQMKGITLGLLPYMKIYVKNWSANGNLEIQNELNEFEAANLELQKAIRGITKRIASNKQSYELSHFVTLVKEVEKLYGAKWDFIAGLESTLPLVYKLKKTLAGGTESEIAAQEWPRFGLLTARGYIQYLRYYYFIETLEAGGQSNELVYLASAVEDLFSFLGDMVRGKPEGVFTRRELKEVLEAMSVVIPAIKVSDGWLLEIMKIKQVLFGGSLDNWVPEDFDRARDKVDNVQALVEQFLSYVYVYGGAWDPSRLPADQVQAYFQQAQDNLLNCAKNLSEILESSYDIESLVKLAKEWDRLYPSVDGPSSYENIARKYVPLLISFKSIITSDESSEIQKTQWKSMSLAFAAVYNNVLQYKYFLKDTPLLSSSGVIQLQKLTKDVLGLVNSWIQSKPEQQIPWRELNVLADSLKSSALLPESISSNSVKSTLRMVLNKVLRETQARLDEPEVKGLYSSHLQVLKSEIYLWLENQKYLELTFQDAPPEGLLATEIIKSLDRAAPTDGLIEMRSVVVSPLALTMNKDAELRLSYNVLPYTQNSIQYINIWRTLVRMALRAYALDADRSLKIKGINTSEANTLFFDLKPLLVDLGLVSAETMTFADARFMEANLFTAQGDGDELLSLPEGVNLFMYLFSAISVNGHVQSEIAQKCVLIRSQTSEKDVFIEKKCFIENFTAFADRLYVTMPDMLKFVKSRDKAGQKELAEALLKSAGAIPDRKGRVNLSDVGLVSHISQYIETVILRFDTNKKGTLTRSEALAAFPVFGPTLKRIGKLDDSETKGLFMWLLKYSKAPDTLWDKFLFKTWWMPKGEAGWEVSADRTKLATILGLISSSSTTVTARRHSAATAPANIRDLNAALQGLQKPQYPAPLAIRTEIESDPELTPEEKQNLLQP